MSAQTARVLYIEDNPQNMRLVRKILAHAGYDFHEAMDGITGVEQALSLSPDLILLDINLPDIDGLEVARRLRESRQTSSTPIIALTANAMVGDRERLLAGGCDGYLPKPVSRTELLNTIDHHLRVTV